MFKIMLGICKSSRSHTGTTIWSPLASGLLTGKYNKELPSGSRATAEGYTWLQKNIADWRKEGKIDKVTKLEEYAKKRFNCSVGQLALAWCAKNKNVSTVLLGATKTEQLEENLGAIPVAEKLTEADMEEIDKILGNKPAGYQGYGSTNSVYRTLTSLDNRKQA
jgi:aryl-alcohol dehydrogenase-like predicted oxidoreductase